MQVGVERKNMVEVKPRANGLKVRTDREAPSSLSLLLRAAQHLGLSPKKGDMRHTILYPGYADSRMSLNGTVSGKPYEG